MQPLRGILLMVLAISCFAVMTAFVKAAGRIPAGETVFFRAFCALPVIAMWLALKGELPSGLRVNSVPGHLVRGIAGSLAMGLGFLGLKYIPLPEATAIRFITPILIVIFAAIFLRERVRMFRITAVAVGLVGVSIIMWPQLTFEGGGAVRLGALVTLASAALASCAQILIKAMAGTERTEAIVFWFSATASLLALTTIPFGWVMPMGIEWFWLIGAGLIGGAGQIFLTSSYRFADAGTLAPFTYLSMIWALVIGFFIFDELPTVGMLIGSALVIAAGVAIVFRERQLGRGAASEGKLRSMMKDR
ncbi:DMT family transporter [Psychromarinibacter halotolerans]|uniref:DMT family transporter n=1 Tax=Psychromarinibacter halotolerans TaxID=1775175 RepID=A0ABV7GRY2_9RHOB|nr:DMT family transporter [Psychromarinibacter halotolerans]MDF0595720.1 DMT family transporter [Psychromarinibacter halotolerans]